MRRIDMFNAAGTPADKHQAGAVEHGNAGAGPVWQGSVGRHQLDFALIATMLIGTSTKPRFSI